MAPVTTEADGLGAALQAKWYHLNNTVDGSGQTSAAEIYRQFIRLDASSRCERLPDMVLLYQNIYQQYLILE